MQAQIDTNQQIRQVTELMSAIGDQKKEYKQKCQRVFNEPIRHVCSADEGVDPNKEEDGDKGNEPDVLFEWNPVL